MDLPEKGKKIVDKQYFMPQITTEVDRLLIYDPDKSRSTCHIFISRPTPLEEKLLGKIFIISEIDSQEKINQEIINIIQEEVKNNFYYSNETNIETAFENALQKANESLHHLISEGITNWLDKFNIIIAVIRETDLYLTHIGRIHAFLIHQDKIIDILAQAGPIKTEVNPLKIFSNTISGKINPSDQILFCTSSILDYFSQEKLKRVIAETAPQEAVSQLEKILIEAEANTSFGAIVIKLVPQEKPEIAQFERKMTIPTSVSAPQISMDELIQKEKKTSEYLTPSILPNVVKNLRKYYGKGKDFIRIKILKKTPKRRPPQETYLKPVKRERPKWGKELVLQIVKDLKVVLRAIASFFLSLVNLVRRRKEIKDKIKEFPQETEQKIHGGIFKFKRLSKKSKTVLISALIILFIFSTSVVILGLRKEARLSKERKEEIIKIIKDKTFEAGAALSYEDERGAKKLLSEARQLLAQLPNRKKGDKRIVAELEAGISEQYDKTKHIINISDPLLKKDFREINNQVRVLDIIQTGDFVYLSNSNNEIYELDLEASEVRTIKNTLTEIGQFKLSVKETGSTILYFHDKKGVVEFNTLTEKFTPLSIDFPEESNEVKVLAVYRSRFYYLDPFANQIYRYQRGTSGFGTATSWIHDPNLNLQNGVSIVIDGSIYLLESNGKVKEFFQGRELDFSLDVIDPSLSSGTKIWTDEDSNYLYILDPQNKRLVQFDKKGNLKNQYYSDKFADLKAFSISETAQKAWLLAGFNVFEITISL